MEEMENVFEDMYVCERADLMNFSTGMLRLLIDLMLSKRFCAHSDLL